MTWTSFSFSAGQVLTAAQMNNMYANFAALAAGDSGAPTLVVPNNGVSAEGKIVDGVVAAGKLKTTSASVSLTANSGTPRNEAITVATGGAYILSYQSAASFSDADSDSDRGTVALVGHADSARLDSVSENVTSDTSWYVLSGGRVSSGATEITENSTVSQASNLYLLAWRQGGDSADTQTVTMYTRYVQASPPYDLGDGTVAGFVYALLDANGDIVGYSIGEDPPWFGNVAGAPLRVTDDLVIEIVRDVPKQALIDGTADLDAYLSGVRAEVREITMADKLYGMNVVPHPFARSKSGLTAVMLDPMSDMTYRLITAHAIGEPVDDLLYGGYVKVSNEQISRAKPDGVMAVSMSFKNNKNGGIK